MAKTNHLEIKVGIFVLVGVIILMTFILTLGANRLFKERMTFIVELDFVEGLKRLAPVNISGHESGLVKKVSISPRGRPVQVVIEIDKSLTIPRDSKIFVNSLGVLGEKYVEIIPGNSDEYIRQSDIIKGESSIPLKIISDQIKELSEGFSGVVKSLNDILSDPELTDDVKQLINNLSNTFAQTSKILEEVEKGNGTLGKFIYDDSLYSRLNEFIDDIAKNPWKLFHVPRKTKTR